MLLIFYVMPSVKMCPVETFASTFRKSSPMGNPMEDARHALERLNVTMELALQQFLSRAGRDEVH